MTYQAVIDTPIGKLGIGIYGDNVSHIDFVVPSRAIFIPKTKFAKKVVVALQEYFNNSNYTFNLPLAPSGTPFQQKVWQALLNIPVGSTKTYGEVAKQLATGPRAVGNACRQNPIPIIIPCHRVVATQHIGGYSGATKGKKLGIKKWLMHHEATVTLPK